MEIIKWGNNIGVTLRLTQKEIEELAQLCKSFVKRFRGCGDSRHFTIERKDDIQWKHKSLSGGE